MKANRKKSVLTTYTDAVEFRSENKRLVIQNEGENQNIIIFTRTLEEGENPDIGMAMNMNEKDKKKSTILNLSDEGLRSLYESIGFYLQLGEINKE